MNPNTRTNFAPKEKITTVRRALLLFRNILTESSIGLSAESSMRSLNSANGLISNLFNMGKKRSSLKLPNTVWFVAHPYASPPRGDMVGNICLWNRSSPHHRKLIESTQATVVTSENQVLTQQEITFIGEWECCSSFVPSGQNQPFNLIHTPIHSKHDAFITKCVNTDPYVFGNEFKWISCKQPADRNQIHIGDFVIFGSYLLKNRKVDKILIDTVLLVDKVISVEDFDPTQFSKCYNDVTIAHTRIHDKFYIVLGKMYDPTKSYEQNVPFSFVPCRRAEDGLMDKLAVDCYLPIKELGGYPLCIGQSGGHLDIDDNIAAWRVVVDLVRSAGCELGVFMPEPTLPTSNSIIDNEAKSIISKQNKNEKISTSCSGGTSGSHC